MTTTETIPDVLADMDLIIEQEHGSEFGARSLKEHLISFRARLESALASAEPVSWYAPSIDDTCTAAKKAQRERDLPETARLFTVPLYAHAQTAAKVEAQGRDAGPSFDDVCRTIRAYGLACIDLGMEGMSPNSPTPASVPDGWTIKPYFDGYKVTPPGGHECTVLIEGEEDSHSSSIEDVTLHTLCAALLATNQEGAAP